MEIYRARGGCQDVRLLLLPFLDVLREPLKALKQTFSGCRTTVGNEFRSTNGMIVQEHEERTLCALTTTYLASGEDPTSR